MQKPKRILIADIDSDLLTKLEILFEDKGYQTTTAWSGQEAIHQLHSMQFDFVLLSDYLPDVSAKQLWRALECLPVCPSVAVLETAQPVREIANRYQRLGGRCILSKSSPYQIVETVHQCLRSGESYPLTWKTGSVTAGAKAGSATGST